MSQVKGILAAATASLALSWVAPAWPQPVVSIKDFGAVCDGATVDTSKIQAALNSGARHVYAPAGICVVGTITVRSSVELVGDGWNETIFKLINGVNAAVF